jgi:DMSO/TMAO reductase YedYZ molybdopterin-dependent catalytic subunit
VVRLPRSLSSIPPPPGPFRRSFWRSPIRGPWLTAFFGSILLVGITVMFATGLLSYTAYNPGLRGNDQTPGHHLLKFFFFDWPTHPYWLYRFTQGLHVTLGLVLIPVLLGKLWSVIPKLFEWPPVRSPAHLIERVSLLLLVGGAVFEFVTGIMNIQYWYVFPGSFYTLHLYGAWVFMAAFVVHVGTKFPKMVRALRSRRMRDVLRTDVAHTEPEPMDPDHLVSPTPARPTMSRRGAIGLVGASSLTLLVVTVGQSLGGRLRDVAVLAPRDADVASGPNGFQINKRASEVGITAAETGPSWRLTLTGQRGSPPVVLTRAQLLSMPQHTAHLPIACVEGWSSGNQKWTGVRLRDLAGLAGVPSPRTLGVHSLQKGGAFSAVELRGNQVMNGDSLLALKVNDVDLSLDHGYPARVIVPANPGVHNTKWVERMIFEA